MKKLIYLGTICLSLAMMSACSGGNGKGSKARADSINQANKPMPKKTASEFMVDAAMLNLKVARLGKIGERQATSQGVKNFASEMVKDHEKISRRLKTLAEKKQVKLPDSLGHQQRSEAKDLKDKQGLKFDRAFMKKMLKINNSAVKEYTNSKRNIDDGDVRSFIEITLAVLRKQVYDSQSLFAKIKGKIRGEGGTTASDQ